MNSMQHLPLFESPPQPVKRAPDGAPAASGTQNEQDTTGDDTGVSFPSLLAEKTDRLTKPEAKADEVEAQEVEAKLKGDAVQAESNPPPVVTAPGTLDLEKVMAMLTETEGSQKAVVAAPQVAAHAPSATVAGDVPAILAQGLAVQGQAVQLKNAPELALPGNTTPATPAEQLLAQATGKAAIQVPGAPAVAVASVEVPPAEAAATIETAVNAVAKAATALSAAELETAVKGRETYSQVPVVSESQMMSDTLKNAAKNSAENAAPTAATTAADLPGLVAETAADAGTNTEGGSEETALPQAETGPAPLSLDAEHFQAVENTVKVPHEVVAESVPTETPAALNLDPSAMARPAQSTVQAAATHLASDPTVSRDIKQQVVRHLSTNLSDITGQQKMTIKLNPESLGQIELNFEARDDRLSVAISASTPEAEAALRDNMKDLTDRLVERSARFSHVDVRVEIKDGADARQDNKQDQKQDQKNDERRENAKQGDGNGRGHHGHQDQQSARAQEAWESAMSWQLANEEG